MKTIMSFSGGLDSTYMLYKTLTETNDDVYAFYLDMTNCPDTTFMHKQYMEQVCAMKLAEWMQNNVRPFKFDIVHIGEQFFYEKLPMMQALYFAIPYLNKNLYDRFLMAWSAEDCGVFGNEVRNAMWYRFEQHAKRGTMEFPLFDQNIGRLEQYLKLPKEVLPFLGDCKSINEDHTKCGVCHKCWVKQNDFKKYEEGFSIEQILEERIRQKNTNVGMVDNYGRICSWYDEENNQAGTVITSTDPHHQEYWHVFTKKWDNGIHEPDGDTE